MLVEAAMSGDLRVTSSTASASRSIISRLLWKAYSCTEGLLNVKRHKHD